MSKPTTLNKREQVMNAGETVIYTNKRYRGYVAKIISVTSEWCIAIIIHGARAGEVVTAHKCRIGAIK